MTGTVDLRSGTWSWQAFEVRELPSGRVETTYVALRRADSPTSRVVVRFAGSVEGITEAGLGVAAKHPWEREVQGPKGLIRFHTLNRPDIAAQGTPVGGGGETYSVLYHTSDGRVGSGVLPYEVGLGYATDEELLRLVKST